MTQPIHTLEEAIRFLDESTEPLSEHDVEDVFGQVHKHLKGIGQMPSDKLRWESTAFMFSPAADRAEPAWNTYYGPSIAYQDGDGNPVWVPDIKHLTPSVIEYWFARAQQAKHPVLRVRYADLGWDLARKVTGKNADVGMAAIVVDDTLIAANRGLFKHPTEAFDRLGRALDVAIGINDLTRIMAVRDAVIAYEDAVAQDHMAGLWGHSFDMLVENDKVTLSHDQQTKIVGDLEGRLQRLTDPSAGDVPDHFSAKSTALRLARHYRRTSQPDGMKRVLRTYGAAVVRASEKPAAMIASAWLRHAYDAYRQFEMHDDAADVARRMRQHDEKIPGQMTTYKQDIEINNAELDETVRTISEGGFHAALGRIGLGFVPSKDIVIESVKSSAEQSVLMSMISLKILDHKGRPVAVVGPLKVDLPGRIAFEMSEMLRLGGVHLLLVLNRIHELFHPSADDYVTFLTQSPLFQPEKLPLIKAGLSAYLAGDMVGAAHILIPQFEDAMRTLVDLAGGTIYKSHRGGGFLLKNLDELLREEVATKVLGEDRVRYLNVVYTDQRGWNLRNTICHGTMPAAEFGRPICDRIVQTFLLLGTVRRSGPEEGSKSS